MTKPSQPLPGAGLQHCHSRDTAESSGNVSEAPLFSSARNSVRDNSLVAALAGASVLGSDKARQRVVALVSEQQPGR